MLRSAKNAAKEKWMPCPKIDTNHPCLVHLCPLDTLIVDKQLDALHEVIGKKNNTGFSVYNKSGQKILIAVKDNDNKTFNLKVYNKYGNEVVIVKGGKEKASIWAPSGNLMGTIERLKSCDCNEFIFTKTSGVDIQIVKVNSPINVTHNIISPEDIPIGRLTENNEVEDIDADNFGISFPMDMQVEDKAALLGACFFIRNFKIVI